MLECNLKIQKKKIVNMIERSEEQMWGIEAGD